jgi:flagellar basal-body rod protein FlgG
MFRSLWTSATGMIAQQQNLDVVANNLANVSTPGFKKSRAEFEDLVYQDLLLPGAETSLQATNHPTGAQIGAGTRLSGITKIMSPGELLETNREFDLAIDSEGFFQVLLPDGQIAYTRAGNFQKSAEGVLVTPEGYPLFPEIVVPQEVVQIQVSPDGLVTGIIPGQEESPIVLGQIELARFINPSGLKAIGKNLFVQTYASGDPIVGIPGEEGFGRILQGFLEVSNVNAIQEMIAMLLAQRVYEMNSRAVTATDNIMATTVNIVR